MLAPRMVYIYIYNHSMKKVSYLIISTVIHVVFSMFMDFSRCKANKKNIPISARGVFQWIRFSPTSTVPIFTCFSELGIAPGTARLPPRLLRLLLRPPTSTVSGGCRWKASSSPQISTPRFYTSKVSIAPENRGSQKETSIPTIHFHVRFVSFREGM